MRTVARPWETVNAWMLNVRAVESSRTLATLRSRATVDEPLFDVVRSSSLRTRVLRRIFAGSVLGLGAAFFLSKLLATMLVGGTDMTLASQVLERKIL